MPNTRRQTTLSCASFGGGMLAMLLIIHFFASGVGRAPKPGPVDPADIDKHGTGSVMIALRDFTAPTIPEALTMNGQTAKALKVKHRLRIYGIRDESAIAKNYTSVLGKVGGAPAFVVLADDGCEVKSGRWPTDEKALEKLVTTYLADPPAPLSKPRAMVAREAGGESRAIDGEIIDEDGVKRKLNARSDRAKLAALENYSARNPVFPRAEWYPLDNSDLFDIGWVTDQGNIGSCVGQSGSRALRSTRLLAGMTDEPLSPTCLYAWINGGQDNGAIIGDIIPALKDHGTCPFDICGQKFYTTRTLPAKAKQEAQRFKITEAYKATNFDEVVSAILTGQFVAVFGVQVGRTWTTFDKDGVCGHDAGPGNHAIMADGVKNIGTVKNPRWVLIGANSWSASWGPFKNGRMLLDEKHLFGNGNQADCVVIRSVQPDPEDPHDPPALKLTHSIEPPAANKKAREPQAALAN